MLIKLGQVWADPGRIACLASSAGDITILIDGLEFTVASNVSSREVEGAKDEVASIINNALVGQSYGGGNEEVENSSS